MNRYRTYSCGEVLVGALLALALFPAAALAAPPTVTTGGVADVTQSTATLTGTVNPQGQRAPSVVFQYGTTTLYGAQTTAGRRGSGTSRPSARRRRSPA